jgi:glutathione S-transferase
MGLTLHYHPLSSFCWKVLIALYENGTPFDARLVDLGDPAARAAFKALWPTAKIPLMEDDGRVVPETSIMIEHLDRHHPGTVRLLPQEAEERLEARLWDRLFDAYVLLPMQRFIGQQLRPEAERDPRARADAEAALGMAYDMIEEKLAGRTWAAGKDFTMADCAAAPALFYAVPILPFPAGHVTLAGYFDRLMARPSVRRTVAEARPYFQFYPLAHALAARFLADETGAA